MNIREITSLFLEAQSRYDIPRQQMPQISAQHLEQDYQTEKKVVPLHRLRPSQSQRTRTGLDRAIQGVKGGEFVKKPIVVDQDYNIVNGHHRYDALKHLGMKKAFVLQVSATLKDLVDAFSHTTSKEFAEQQQVSETSVGGIAGVAMPMGGMNMRTPPAAPTTRKKKKKSTKKRKSTQESVQDGIQVPPHAEYQGNCTQDDVVDEIFGSVTDFAQAVDEHGDEFHLGDLLVTYDPDEDVHHFYYV